MAIIPRNLLIYLQPCGKQNSKRKNPEPSSRTSISSMAAAMEKLILLSVLLLPLVLSSPLGSIFHQHKATYRPSLGADPGDPLYLTPYIKKGDVATGEVLHDSIVSTVIVHCL